MSLSTHLTGCLDREPVHKRVPAEIWELIFRNLYPSQLSHFSLVDKRLNAIVSSLEVWSHMFAVAHGPEAHLRPLAGISRSKSYMIFMCSSSLHVCEKCYGLTAYNADNLSDLPLPMPILLPRRSKDTTIKYLDQVAELSLITRKGLIDEATVIMYMRQHLGGDVGIEASKESTAEYDEKTETRIRWYQCRE
ncbi:hypothetical protein BGZ83_001261 [Gryganskiella cystojenkinii]|nr:hypothetical protein BGZ83_001261 [Gryganskiella cystojenkinii]